MGYLKDEFKSLMEMIKSSQDWEEPNKQFAYKFFMTGAACIFYKSVNIAKADNEEESHAMFDDFQQDLVEFKAEMMMAVIKSGDVERIEGMMKELMGEKELMGGKEE